MSTTVAASSDSRSHINIASCYTMWSDVFSLRKIEFRSIKSSERFQLHEKECTIRMSLFSEYTSCRRISEDINLKTFRFVHHILFYWFLRDARFVFRYCIYFIWHRVVGRVTICWSTLVAKKKGVGGYQLFAARLLKMPCRQNLPWLIIELAIMCALHKYHFSIWPRRLPKLFFSLILENRIWIRKVIRSERMRRYEIQRWRYYDISDFPGFPTWKTEKNLKFMKLLISRNIFYRILLDTLEFFFHRNFSNLFRKINQFSNTTIGEIGMHIRFKFTTVLYWYSNKSSYFIFFIHFR